MVRSCAYGVLDQHDFDGQDHARQRRVECGTERGRHAASNQRAHRSCRHTQIGRFRRSHRGNGVTPVMRAWVPVSDQRFCFCGAYSREYSDQRFGIPISSTALAHLIRSACTNSAN